LISEFNFEKLVKHMPLIGSDKGMYTEAIYKAEWA